MTQTRIFWRPFGRSLPFVVLLGVVSLPAASTRSQEAAPAEGEAVTADDGSAARLDPELEPILAHCNEQAAQPFLIRSNYIRRHDMSDDERAARDAAHERAIRYRTEQYGYFAGFGEPEWNDSTPSESAAVTEFMGIRVEVNRRIIPALTCVEAEIRRSCADTPYQPHRVTGLRTRNTFHTGEISNHVYGIAVDIDSDLNTCCGCTARWRSHPLCRVDVDSIFERMAMPECWVHAFERYGFYWLGWDELEDTMHFEFLGDPDQILRESADAATEPVEREETTDVERAAELPEGGGLQ